MVEPRSDSPAANPHIEDWSADELIPFGKYMLLDRISGGGTSAVYRANVRGEAGFERLVAIKRILPHMAGDPEFVKTFVREAKTVARLTHSNICPIYELGKVGESLYMAIEYIAGKDLGRIARRLARRGMVMPPHVAAYIAARLCDALDYAHSLKTSTGENAGVVHRDLSPSNIIVSYEGGVKLIDFGLAKAVGRAQQTNVDALKKKLGYMSPEMVKGRPLDARSDIFGVGVCLYEMLTGRRLFVGKDDIDTLKLVGTAAVPPPSAVSDDVPDDLEVLVMRSLEKNPDDRFQSAAEMGQILNAWLHKVQPGYNTQSMCDWINSLFSTEVAEENARIKKLLAASSDNNLMAARRMYFASPTGAAARARAEVARRMSTEPPAMRTVLNVTAPKPPRLPSEARQSRDAPEPLEEPTGFYDRDKTQSSQNVHTAETRVGPGHDQSAFEDEPTSYHQGNAVASLPPVKLIGFTDPPNVARNSLPPGDTLGGFEDEATQYLQELELEAMIIPGQDNGGFEDESTHIFFNKEEGVGVPALLSEINDVQDVPRGLNKPIIAAELGLSPPVVQPHPVHSQQPMGSFARPPAPISAPGNVPAPFAASPPQQLEPPAPSGGGGIPIKAFASQPPDQPVATQTRRPGSTLSGMHAPVSLPPLQVPPPAAHAAGASQQLPPLQAAQYDLPAQHQPMPQQPQPLPGPRTARHTVRQQSQSSTWLFAGTIAILLGAIGALVVLTPLGVALGVRKASVGSIEVRARTDQPVKAAVLLDDIHRGSAPLRLDRVPAGLHRVEVRAVGYLPSSREVQVSTDITVRLELELVRDTREKP
jgi:serine/threonine protein kinase